MFCPNCGTENNKNQNYCRFCGLNIEESAKSLKLQLSFGVETNELKKNKERKRLLRLISDNLTIVFVISLFAIIYFDPQNLKEKLKVAVGLFFAFQLLKYAFNNYFSPKNTKNNSVAFDSNISEQNSLEGNSKILDETKPFMPISSVTENSTELLFVENKTRKLE
jgi:zinc-ribbon domain